jgi:hypothetical protein
MNGEILGTYPEIPDLKSGDYEFYCSAHSVVVKNVQTGLWRYVFVTDSDLTGAPDKLRWPSIKELWAKESYLLILHSRPTGGGDFFFILNVLNGKCAELNYQCDEQEEVKFSDDVFSVTGIPVVTFKNLIDALESFIPG